MSASLILAACGDDDDAADTTSAAVTTTAASAVTTVAGGSTTTVAASTTALKPGNDIKIMVVAPFTLPNLPMKPIADTVKAYADMANENGGLHGHKVTVIACDDQNDPNVAASCARKATEEKVVALVSALSLQGTPMWPILEAAKIPSFGLRQTTPADNNSPMAYPIDPGSSLGYTAGGAFMVKERGCKKVYYIGADVGIALQSQLGYVKEGVTKAGGEYVGESLFSATASPGDFSPIANTALSKANCFFLSGGGSANTIIRAIYQINPDVKFIGADGGLGSGWEKELGKAAENVTQFSGLAPLTEKAPGVEQFTKEMTKRSPNTVQNGYAERGWGVMIAFDQVVGEIDGDVTNESFIATLEKQTNVETGGITAPINFTKTIPMTNVPRQFNTKLAFAIAKDGVLVVDGDFQDGVELLGKL